MKPASPITAGEAKMPRAAVVLLCCAAHAPAAALDNGAALKPPMGWQNWNGFGMAFNASLFRSMASAMKENGMLAAGYDLVSAGGSTYPHQGLAPHWNSTNDTNIVNVIVRNETGYYQIDPARFPGPGSSAACLDEPTLRACLANHSKNHDIANWPNGDPALCGCVDGNGGMAALSAELRAQGFRWGSYSNEAGCKVAACDRPELNASKFRGFIDEDYDLMVNTWTSDYIMVDSVGNEPPYDKTDQRWWHWQETLLTEWSKKVAQASRPIILHSCHNRCGSTFSGPTLLAATCNKSDLSQQWTLPTEADKVGTTTGYLRDAGEGLCVGCGDYFGSPCGNDALTNETLQKEGLGYGGGMQACGGTCPECSKNQQFNYSSVNKTIVRTDGSCLQKLSGGQVVVQRSTVCSTLNASQQWTPIAATTAGYSQMQSVASPGMCLSSSAHVQYPLDPWCASNNNMWRSSTDTLQVWSRVMVQVESLVGLGTVSGPGHWGFGDCLELGVPGGGVLTWEESKSHLALFAVTSQPLFLGNDVRPGFMQQRLLDILVNEDMLTVDQEYALGFAGDRVWTGAVGKEVWAKPLPGGRAGVVLFNRNGTTSTCNALHIGQMGSLQIPCDDNVTESSGAQDLTLDFDVLPAHWLLGQAHSSESGGGISCEVRDIFSGETGKVGSDLGRFVGAFHAKEVPPHGSRFLLLGNCTSGVAQQ